MSIEAEPVVVAQEQHGQDLTRGNLKRQLWSLAWPIMLSIFFYTLYNIVDAVWVSKLSAESIAAVSISQIALFVMIALSMGITVGSGVLISMHIGAKEKDEAERVLGQSFVLAGILGIFFTVLSLVFRSEILTVSGAAGAVFEPALTYFTIVAAGAILMFIMMTIVFAFNAQGDSFTPTKLFAASTLINLILDPILIFGWQGIPSFGIAGAAYATLISQFLFIVAALYMLSRKSQMIPFHFRNLTLKWESVKRVLDIGIPASLTQVIQPLALAALMFITAQSFYEAGTVAFSIGFRIEFFAYLPAVGFGFGSMALIGQNIGAGNFDRAREAFFLALKYGVGAALALGLIAIVFSKQIVHVFTTDPLVTAYVASYILTVGLTYGFLAASLVEVTAFQAMGRSWPGFWLSVLRLIVIAVPISYVSTAVLHFPISAVWLAIAFGNVIAAGIGYWWVREMLRAEAASRQVVYETQAQ